MEADRRILDKIRKLKALGEGAATINSMAESEAATLAMNKLLTKHNLSLLDIDGADSGKPSVEIERSYLISVQNPYGRLWKERLLTTLCMYNFCKIIGCSDKVFILGTRVNTMTVIDFFNTLQSVYLQSAKERYDQDKRYFRGGRLTEKYKREYITSYLLGCSIGLSVKLRKIQSQECTAVAVRHNELIRDYISEKLNVVKSKPLKQPKLKESAYLKGFENGKKTKLQKTINF
jgi:hypothetical protein